VSGTSLESLASRAPFPVEIGGVPPGRLDPRVEVAVYYLAVESPPGAGTTIRARLPLRDAETYRLAGGDD
jgi:hypothetical protein